MNIEVDVEYLPGIYEKYLELYDRGIPIDKLGFKQMSGGSLPTVDFFIVLYEAIKANGYKLEGECKFRNDIPKKYSKYSRITPIT